MKRLLFLLACAGCSVDGTEMLVSVTSGDLELDGLELDVIDPMLVAPDSTLYSKTITVCKHGESRPGCYELPVSITLVPGPKHPDHPVRVEVGGIVGSQVVVRNAAVFHFTKGVRQKIEFVLYSNCIGKDCADRGLSCDSTGQCIDVAPTSSIDLGVPPDLSAPDLASADLSRDPDLSALDLATNDLQTPPDFSERPDIALPPKFGDGLNGSLIVPSPSASPINSVATTVSGNSGESTLQLTAISNFGAGETLFLHQSQGTGAGVWEINYLEALDSNTNVATLRYPLAHDFITASGRVAQAIVVPRFTDVTIAAGGTLNAPAWNGATGGILVLQASGTVTVGGTITMDGSGYRALWHMCGWHNPASSCDPSFAGYPGESSLGPSVVKASPAPNGQGGGASLGGDCSGGAGGGHATVGGIGTPRCGFTAPEGGLTVGTANLNVSLFMGGGGGEGGGKTDCAPGPGGAGGGIIFLMAHNLVVTGSLSANGKAAVNHDVYEPICPGTGCALGGGGAGGAVRLVTDSAQLGSGLVHVAGGLGATAACGPAKVGGDGGDGRIGVRSPSVTGTTNPTYDGN